MNDDVTHAIETLLDTVRPTLMPHGGLAHFYANSTLLEVNEEAQRLIDILCWQREDPRVIFSVPEMIEIFGRQIVNLARAALYLQDTVRITNEDLSKAIETQLETK